MLEELMRECRNWFVAPNGVHHGVFTIKDGSISLPFLVPGQYFRIVGSVLNDGVYQYGVDQHEEQLKDETFDGAVWALLVPHSFVELSEAIKLWRDEYEKAANSPFQSESFAGYSYAMKSENSNVNGAGNSWKGVFGYQLSVWRKL